MSDVQIGHPLPKKLLEHEVLDPHGTARALGSYLEGASILVYLRHFG